ncbi:MAG: ParB N-terminal domain-containing protein [Spirochaetes bacterium]|nr:ParB N-terminal domain-containing protein [Spirochaetota bacterium]
MKVSIATIRVRKRIRRDLGDIESLRESIQRIGMITPIIISDDRELLAGYRRLLVAQQLGWNEIECHVVKAGSRRAKFDIEVEENISRKGFSPQEIDYIDDERRYLNASLLRKFLILLMRLLHALVAWASSSFGAGRRCRRPSGVEGSSPQLPQ